MSRKRHVYKITVPIKILSVKVPNLTPLLNIKKILTTMLLQNLTTNVMTPVIRIIYNDVITGKMTDK